MNYLENPEGASVTLRLNANRAALHFNAMHIVGTRVKYWADEKVGEPTGTARTNTAAYVFGDLVAAVGLETTAAQVSDGTAVCLKTVTTTEGKFLSSKTVTIVVPLDNVEVIS